MSDLFPIDETLSPRLAWLRANNLSLRWVEDNNTEAFEGHHAGKPWVCEKESEPDQSIPGYGIDDDEAIEAYAMWNNIKLWYQE